MRKPRLDEQAELPFPLSEVSNGEFSPRPPTKQQIAVKKLLMEEADKRAKRLGMTRREFLRTAAGTATAFMVMNTVYGLPSSGGAAVLRVNKEQCDDPEAAQELFQADYFVMDVQIHHVDLEQFGDIPALGCLRFRPTEEFCTPEGLQNLSQANMIKEVFVDSETAVGVISGVPNGVPLPPQTMAATRDLANELANSVRCLSQAMIDPHLPLGSGPTALDTLPTQAHELGACGVKTYTGNGNWYLDDEAIAYPMYDLAVRNKLKVINVHKGLPEILGGMSEEYVRTIDIPKAVADWPQLKFVIYHAGHFPNGSGIDEFISVLEGMRRRHRRRVYAEIGSTFALHFLQGPDQAAHLLGKLLKTCGSRRILWGTDSIWWGSPQWQIDAFKALQIPESMQEEFGYPELRERHRARIFGRNAAKLYKVRWRKKRCEIDEDGLSRVQQELGGPRNSRTHFVYGPRTEEQYRMLVSHSGDPTMVARVGSDDRRKAFA